MTRCRLGVSIMTIRRTAFAALLATVRPGLAATPPDPPPPWAFPLNPSDHHGETTSPTKPEHVPGSTATYSLAQLENPYLAADWFPATHPKMPPIVAVGRKPNSWACGFCHLPTGQGGPESAALTGLPSTYIVEQVLEMRAGRRRCGEPQMIAPNGMAKEARAVNTADLQEAADYYSRLIFQSHLRIVETDTVPKTQTAGVSVLAPIPGAGTEPLRQRIIEVPDD